MRDWAKHGGRRYTDKAPGSSLLAAGAYLSLRWTSRPSEISMHRLARQARLWILILPWCLLLPAWAAYLGGAAGSLTAGRVLALAHAIATPAFTYHQRYFGHGIVAMCLAIALIVAVPLGAASGEGRWRWWRPIVAGAAVGLAALTEYQALPLLLVFGVYLLVVRGRESALLFGLACLPFVAALGVYNHVCFGGVFELSYHHLGPPDLAAVHGAGIGGVRPVPTAEGLEGILTSPSRGLWYHAPWLVLTLAGLGAGLASARRSPVCLLLVAVLYSIWFGSAARTWEAGWSIGPRILVPYLPMWVAAVGLAWGRWRSQVPIALGPLLAVSLIHAFAAAWVFPGYPPSFERPLDHIVPRLLERGWVAPNLAADLGLSGVGSLLPGIVVLLIVCAVAAAALYRHVAWRWRMVAALAAVVSFGALHWPTPPPSQRHIDAFERHVRDKYGKQPVPLGPFR